MLWWLASSTAVKRIPDYNNQHALGRSTGSSCMIRVAWPDEPLPGVSMVPQLINPSKLIKSLQWVVYTLNFWRFNTTGNFNTVLLGENNTSTVPWFSLTPIRAVNRDIIGPSLVNASHRKCLAYMLEVPELLWHVLNKILLFGYGKKLIIQWFCPWIKWRKTIKDISSLLELP